MLTDNKTNIIGWSLRIKHLKLQVNGQVSPEDSSVLHNCLLSAHRHTLIVQ